MTITQLPASVLDAGTLYFAHDRIVCDDPCCCGITALLTGYTTGGAVLVEVNQSDREAWALDGLGEMICEHRAYA